MSSLADRIRWIVATRKISGRELSRRSGLRESHIGMILKRLDANPRAAIETETLLAIARGGAVSLAWLANEIGKPEDDQAPRGPRRLADREEWPTVREAALTMLAAYELEPDDIDAVGRLPDDEIELPGRLTARAVLKLADAVRGLRRRLTKASHE